MISLKEVEGIHKLLIENFGGAYGILDIAGLESALVRPFQVFDDKELYPTSIHKAAALIESILFDHPFVDGNKRTGYVLMRLLLINEGFDIKATQEEKHSFVTDIAAGKTKYEEILLWLQQHTGK